MTYLFIIMALQIYSHNPSPVRGEAKQPLSHGSPDKNSRNFSFGMFNARSLGSLKDSKRDQNRLPMKTRKADRNESDDETVKSDNTDDMKNVQDMQLALTTTPALGPDGAKFKSDDELLDTEDYIKGLLPLCNPYEDSQRSLQSAR